MKIRDFFSRIIPTRKKEHTKVECDTQELKDFVTTWTEHQKWKFENFADFLELVGVKTPVKLSQLDREKACFKCLTANNTEVLISVVFHERLRESPEICVKEGDETRIYFTNCNNDEGEHIPKVFFKTRVIKREGKELSFYYGSYYCKRTLKIDDTHTLRVEIHEPQNNNTDNSEKLVLSDSLEIENYLMSLEQSLEVSHVYRTVINLLGFKEQDVKNSEKILVSYSEKVGDEEEILSEIKICCGKLKKYMIHENGEIFNIFQDGSWTYYFAGTKVLYLPRTQQYVFSITETEENISKVNPMETMSRVKKRISELWKVIENNYRFS